MERKSTDLAWIVHDCADRGLTQAFEIVDHTLYWNIQLASVTSNMPSLACTHQRSLTCIHAGSARSKLRPVPPSRQQPNKAFSSPAMHRVHAATNTEASGKQAAKSAKAAVEQGLEAFSKGNSTEALALFQQSLELNPNQDEARAALYNSACCLTKEKQWQAAADAIAKACNEYGLKYTVALKVQ